MANNILLISWIGEVPWGYNYLLVIILLLIISILLYRIRKLQKTIKKTNHSYRFSFDILDNLPFPIFVKDITNDFRYYYWNKESAVQSGISSEEAIGHTDYEIYGEERGEKYRNIDKELVQEGKVSVIDLSKADLSPHTDIKFDFYTILLSECKCEAYVYGHQS